MSKSYMEQLQDFSKTPVGAAGTKGKVHCTKTRTLTMLTRHVSYNGIRLRRIPLRRLSSLEREERFRCTADGVYEHAAQPRCYASLTAQGQRYARVECSRADAHRGGGFVAGGS